MNMIIFNLKMVSLSLMGLLIIGCSSGPVDAASPKKIRVVSEGVYRGEVKLIHLEDGTRCAVFLGSEKGGIDCDWQNNEMTMEIL